MGDGLDVVPSASKWPAKEVHLFVIVDFMSCITVAKQPYYGRLKIKPSYNIVLYYVII